LQSATFAGRAGVHSRKSNKLSDRLQSGPHLFFRVKNDADLNELLETVTEQLDGSVAVNYSAASAKQPRGGDGGRVADVSTGSFTHAEVDATSEVPSAKFMLPAKAVKLTVQFEQAMAYAVIVHGGQIRKGTSIPYFSHLLMVAAIALEYGATEDEAIGALLHDAVEDGGGKARQADIDARFGGEVAAIVAGCTDADVLPKPDWNTRKRSYIAHIRNATDSVRLVSAADKVANARSILKDYRVLGESLWNRFNKGRAESLWYYRELVEAFGTSCDPRVLALQEELRRTMADIESLVASSR